MWLFIRLGSFLLAMSQGRIQQMKFISKTHFIRKLLAIPTYITKVAIYSVGNIIYLTVCSVDWVGISRILLTIWHKGKCIEKGYKEEHIGDVSNRYLDKYRSDRITHIPIKSRDFPTKYITNYNNQYWQIKNTLQKYWPILLQDLALTNILPKRPNTLFRRARNNKNRIAPSKLKGVTTQDREHSL